MGASALQPNAFWNSGILLDHAVDAVFARRVLVHLRHHAGEFGTLVFAPDLCPTHKEALVRSKSIGGLLRSVSQHIKQGHMSNAHAAVVGGVLAQGELAANVHVIDRDEAVVFIDEAGLEVVELLAVFVRPPVVQVALGINWLP